LYQEARGFAQRLVERFPENPVFVRFLSELP
jgi:hypothetical protein